MLCFPKEYMKIMAMWSPFKLVKFNKQHPLTCHRSYSAQLSLKYTFSTCDKLHLHQKQKIPSAKIKEHHHNTNRWTLCTHNNKPLPHFRTAKHSSQLFHSLAMPSPCFACYLSQLPSISQSPEAHHWATNLFGLCLLFFNVCVTWQGGRNCLVKPCPSLTAKGSTTSIKSQLRVTAGKESNKKGKM